MDVKRKLPSTFVASGLSELISIMNTASSVLTTRTHTRTALAVILNDRTRSREHLLSLSSSVTDLLNAEDGKNTPVPKHILHLK